MSNLRSDAIHFANTLSIDSPSSTYIVRLCHQIDDVEERWHKAEQESNDLHRQLAEANARIEGMRTDFNREVLRSNARIARLQAECRAWRAWCDDQRGGKVVPVKGHAARAAVDANNDLGEPDHPVKEGAD